MSGYDLKFSKSDRTGRWAVPDPFPGREVPANVRRAKESCLRIKGVQLFNLLPKVLRDANHRDILMWKNNLDHYLNLVPDQPTVSGLVRAAITNSLIHQIPMLGGFN